MAEGFLSRVRSAFEKRAAPTGTIGSSMETAAELGGLMGGTYLAPDRALNLLGTQRWDRFEEMLRDTSIVAAGVRLFLNLMANAVWTVNPPEGLNGNEEPVAQGYADQAYDALFDMTTSWSSVVRKSAAFRFWGFAILEWTAKRNPDGSIGFLDVEHRPQRTITRWIRDKGGTVEAVEQSISGRPAVQLPRSKIVYAVDDVLTDSPEGVGLFRHLYAAADRLKTFLELEEVGFATDLRGIPVARAPLAEEAAKAAAAGPLGTDARTKAEAIRSARLEPMRNFIRHHVRNKDQGIMLPSDTYFGKTADGATSPSAIPKWALELLNGDSSAFEAMAAAINRLNQELARILGVEHLLLGADGSGSLALARSKVGTFYVTVTSTLQDLVEVFDRDLIRPLAEMNGWPEELWPQMGVNEISDRDLEQIAAILRDLATAGATLMPDDPAVGEIRDMIGLSRPNEDTLAAQLDLSLNPKRKDPINPDDPTLNRNPEDNRVAKMLRSRRRGRLRKRAHRG